MLLFRWPWLYMRSRVLQPIPQNMFSSLFNIEGMRGHLSHSQVQIYIYKWKKHAFLVKKNLPYVQVFSSFFFSPQLISNPSPPFYLFHLRCRDTFGGNWFHLMMDWIRYYVGRTPQFLRTQFTSKVGTGKTWNDIQRMTDEKTIG